MEVTFPAPGAPLHLASHGVLFTDRVLETFRPPPEGFKEPWQGSKGKRISPHWSKPWPDGEPGN
jgi:hypothetical protein